MSYNATNVCDWAANISVAHFLNELNMECTINPAETSGVFADSTLQGDCNHPCIIPICPYSFMANRRFLSGYLPWVTSRANQAVIVVGDYLERINIEVFNCLEPDAAIRKALARGRKIERFVDEALAQASANFDIRRISCREYIEGKACREIVAVLKVYGQQNPQFQRDILRQVETMVAYTDRIPAERKPLSAQEISHLSVYLLEEMALYIQLYREGYPLEFYPGRDLFILRKMAEGHYKQFPYEYAGRTHISVQVDC